MAGKKSAENNGKMFITIVGIVIALILVVVVAAAVFAIKGGSAAEETVEVEVTLLPYVMMGETDWAGVYVI